MLPTPSTSHVNYDRIYEPAEDSYLLLDTLSSKSETDFLSKRFPPGSPSPLVLEVGTGSGVVLAFANANAERIFGKPDVATLGTDVNPYACVATEKTVKLASAEAQESHSKAGIFLGCVVGDLTSILKPGSVDVLIFNPPYVPSEALPEKPNGQSYAKSHGSIDSFAHDSLLLALSTDGGVDGMDTTRQLLSELRTVLSTRGVAYILLCAQNKPDEVMSHVRGWCSAPNEKWAVEKVASSGKTAGWEKLCVIRIWRS